MKVIELTGQVDGQHRLCVELPPDVQPGPVKVLVELTPGEGNSWAAGIARVWASEWSDPREDIYTAEDGEPADEPR